MAIKARILPGAGRRELTIAQHKLAKAAGQRHGQQGFRRDFAALVDQAEVVHGAVHQPINASESVGHPLVQKAQAAGQSFTVQMGAQRHQCVFHDKDCHGQCRRPLPSVFRPPIQGKLGSVFLLSSSGQSLM